MLAVSWDWVRKLCNFVSAVVFRHSPLNNPFVCLSSNRLSRCFPCRQDLIFQYVQDTFYVAVSLSSWAMWTGHFRTITKLYLGNERSAPRRVLITNCHDISSGKLYLKKIKFWWSWRLAQFSTTNTCENLTLRCCAHEHTFSRFRWRFIASFPPLSLLVSCFASWAVLSLLHCVVLIFLTCKCGLHRKW